MHGDWSTLDQRYASREFCFKMAVSGAFDFSNEESEGEIFEVLGILLYTVPLLVLVVIQTTF